MAIKMLSLEVSYIGQRPYGNTITEESAQPVMWMVQNQAFIQKGQCIRTS